MLLYPSIDLLNQRILDAREQTASDDAALSVDEQGTPTVFRGDLADLSLDASAENHFRGDMKSEIIHAVPPCTIKKQIPETYGENHP